jgi:hypothetical protein
MIVGAVGGASINDALSVFAVAFFMAWFVWLCMSLLVGLSKLVREMLGLGGR